MRAVEASDFGRFVQAFRHAHSPRLNQQDLANWMGVSQPRVSQIEGAQSAITSDVILDWCQVLRVPPHIASVFLGATVSSEFDALTADQATSLLDLRLASSRSPVDLAGAADLALVRSMTATFRSLDNRHGGGHPSIRLAASAFLDTNARPLVLHARATAAIKNQLRRAVAELLHLVGWIEYDTGHPAMGRALLLEAVELCEEAGDPALTAEIMGGVSHHAAFLRDQRGARDMALAAKQSAKASGVVAIQAEAAVLEAHGYALAGNRMASVRSLKAAEALFAAIDPADTPTWMGYFDEAYLAAKFGHVLLELRALPAAEKFARRSLRMSEGYERGKLFNTVLLASILAEQRNADEAAELGRAAIKMARDVNSVRATMYLADLARRLAPARGLPAVRALFRSMKRSGVPVPNRR
ncbi:transcriptional regulator with XRE-family HTH domain [Crossiella equi]|uniref:Transcriptional regulator with XRE-family HTH domain n=1 Tax=Crossiella equi TaxID=130796 RepID=A0ABS5A735_9PSEU|nr:helix-turn-helix transcriptional regulator [Crossiella equi]MBP2472411.1 transcriptional regulator with XRE-family HTH domain [Crossiella equi]